MSEQKRKQFKITWIKFYPADLLLEIMNLSDAEAGKRTKLFLKNLMENKAPKESLESRLLDEAKTFSDLRRQAVMQRWTRSREAQQQQKQGGKPPRAPKLPPPLGMEDK